MTNIVPFPKKRTPGERSRVPSVAASYEFTEEELDQLCRWYSAMKYAFPRIQGVMAVCHSEKVSAVGLYGEAGTTPNCLISKHEAEGGTYLMWATEQDSPRIIATLSEITDAQIVAIAPPRNEARWLDSGGWLNVISNRMVAGPRPRGLSPHPA